MFIARRFSPNLSWHLTLLFLAHRFDFRVRRTYFEIEFSNGNAFRDFRPAPVVSFTNRFSCITNSQKEWVCLACCGRFFFSQKQNKKVWIRIKSSKPSITRLSNYLHFRIINQANAFCFLGFCSKVKRDLISVDAMPICLHISAVGNRSSTEHPWFVA